MIKATQADRPQIEAFLSAHAPMSMFPLSNLARYGMAGGHKRACSFWLRRANGVITDVLTMSDEGSLFPQCPTGFADVAPLFRGQTIKAVLGEAGQSDRLRATLGLTSKAQLDVTEPGYALDLDRLVMPDAQGHSLQPLSHAPRELLIRWRAGYCVESLSTPADQAVAIAQADIDGYLERGTHRVLMDGSTPVAMTGFNASLPEIVQIGGVYTPPNQRNRGFARIALALHLAEAHAVGVRQAVLFAANPAAEAAYRAIGFQPNGQFSIVVFETEQVVHG